MNHKHFFCHLMVLSMLVFMGCKPSRPAGVLSESKMEDIMVDYHLAQGMAETQDLGVEVSRYKYLQAVFKKHNVTEAEFDSSLVFYSTHSETFVQIYQNVCKRIQNKAERMGIEAEAAKNVYSKLTNFGDTANIWSDKSFAIIIPNKQQNLYQFTLQADSSFHVGDSFLWHFHTQFISQSYTHEAYACLNVLYSNDSVANVTYNLRGVNTYELKHEPRNPLDTIPVRSISGFIYMPMQSPLDKNFLVMIVKDFALIKMHAKAKHETISKIDSLEVDSLSLDSSQIAPRASNVRLSPLEMRNSQPREHRINVVKEKPVRRMGNTNRRSVRRTIR